MGFSIFIMKELEATSKQSNMVEPAIETGKKHTGKPKRGQANRRERVRTENVNVGFDKLRKLIPTDPKDRKLSKIEVLRLATSYINHLYNLTKANSCLEAKAHEEIALMPSPENVVTDEDDDDDEGDNISSNKETRKASEPDPSGATKPTNEIIFKRQNHVCTFCLMMTKTTSSVSTKRK